MTDLNTRLGSVSSQDMTNPIIAELVNQMVDSSVCADESLRDAIERANNDLMNLVDQEKAQQAVSCDPEPSELDGVIAIAAFPKKQKCDLFTKVSKIEKQKGKQVAVLDLPSADAGKKGSGQLDSKEVALSGVSSLQGNTRLDSKQVAGAGKPAGQGNTDIEDKEVATPNTAPLSTPQAANGNTVWMRVQLWDNSDRTRCVKYYSKYDIKMQRSKSNYHTRTLYLNFTSHRSFVKNYKTILTDRQDWGKPVEQFYDMWRKRSLDELKDSDAARPPLIGLVMSDPKSIAYVDRGKDGKDKPLLRVPTKNGKEIRNDYWPGYVGMLFWDECDNPHIWLGIHGQGDRVFSLMDGKNVGDWEPKTDFQRRHDHRPCDFIGYWHQEKAQQELFEAKVRRLKKR